MQEYCLCVLWCNINWTENTHTQYTLVKHAILHMLRLHTKGSMYTALKQGYGQFSYATNISFSLAAKNAFENKYTFPGAFALWCEQAPYGLIDNIRHAHNSHFSGVLLYFFSFLRAFFFFFLTPSLEFQNVFVKMKHDPPLSAHTNFVCKLNLKWGKLSCSCIGTALANKAQCCWYEWAPNLKSTFILKTAIMYCITLYMPIKISQQTFHFRATTTRHHASEIVQIRKKDGGLDPGNTCCLFRRAGFMLELGR